MTSTLQDRIANNRKTVLTKGPNGVLQEQADPQDSSIQELSGQAGLPAPPIDPVSAGVLGASPHTQKMMGTPNQVQSAIRIAQDPSQNLATAERQQQVRSAATAAEQASQQKSKNLQDLGGLGDRVNQFIEGQRQKVSGTAVQATAVQAAPTPGTTGLPTDPNQLASVKDAAKALLANPQDMNALLNLNKALGRDPTSTVAPEEIKNLYESATDTLARSGAEAVNDSLHVEDLVAQGDFGYDLHSLSGLLNVPEDQLGKMNVAQLREAIDAESQTEFNKSSQLQNQATSGNIGSAERQVARQMGQEASRTGTRSSEADFHKLDQSIQNADQVSFGGQSYRVDDLLRDDTISGIIKDYLDSGEGSPTRQRLEKTEPGLIQFIKKNEAILDDAAKQIQTGAQQFTDIQKSNQGLGKVGNTGLDKDLMKTLLPGYGELSATKLDPNQLGFFQQLQTLPPEQQEKFAAEANDLSRLPGVKDELAHLTKEQLSLLNLDQGASSPAIQKFMANQKVHSELTSLAPSDTKGVIEKYTGGAYSDPADIQHSISTIKAAKTLGIGDGDYSMFDQDNDGKVDSPDTLYQRMMQETPAAKLADAAAGNTHTFEPKKLTAYQPQDPISQLIFSKLGNAAQDGDITPKEIQAAGLSEDDAYSISDSGAQKKWGPAGTTVLNMISEARKKHTANALNKYPTQEDFLKKNSNQALEPLDLDGVSGNVLSQKKIDSLRQTAASEQTQHDALASFIKEQQAVEGGRRIDLSSLNERLQAMEQNMAALTREADTETAQRADQVTKLQNKKNDLDKQKKENNKPMSPMDKLASGVDQVGNVVTDVAKMAGSVPAGIGKVADKITNSSPSPSGCFIAGSLFRLFDGTLRPVESLLPGEEMLLGGTIHAIATFVGQEMYTLRGVAVSGSHAVYWNHVWIRVRDCPDALRQLELDGCLVYTVWNECHRMLHEKGILFADYAETDSTHQEIQDRRNLAELSEGLTGRAGH